MSTTTESSSTDRMTFAATLVRFAHAIDHLYTDASRAHGLTPQQTHLLCVLLRGSLGMTELSQVLNLERSGLSGLVDRVERRGLVERVPDEHDRRAIRVTLTRAGFALALSSHVNVSTMVEAMLDDLDGDAQEQLEDAIGQMLARHSAQVRARRAG